MELVARGSCQLSGESPSLEFLGRGLVSERHMSGAVESKLQPRDGGEGKEGVFLLLRFPSYGTVTFSRFLQPL